MHHLSFLPHFPNAALDDPVILLDLCSVLQLCDVTELELELDLELEQDFDEDERVLVLGLVLRLNVFVEYLAEEVFFFFERLNFSGLPTMFSNL